MSKKKTSSSCDEVTHIIPIADKRPYANFQTCVIDFRVMDKYTMFDPGETKHLRTGISVVQPDSGSIFFIMGTSKSAFFNVTPKLTWIRSEDTAALKNITIPFLNRSCDSHAKIMRDKGLPILIFCLLTVKPSINPLHIFTPRRTFPEDQNVKRHDVPRISVKKTASSTWTVKLGVSGVKWNKYWYSQTRHGYIFTTHVVFDPTPAKINYIDGAREMVCSHRNVFISSLQRVSPSHRRSPCNGIRLFLECHWENNPPKELFIQFSLCAYRASMIFRKNPRPFIEESGRGVLVVKCPRPIRLRNGERAVLTIDNGYSMDDPYQPVFLPYDIANANISIGLWRELYNLTISVGAVCGDCNLGYLHPLGEIHFFPTDTFNVRSITKNLSTCPQLEVYADLMDRNEDSDDDDTDIGSEDEEVAVEDAGAAETGFVRIAEPSAGPDDDDSLLILSSDEDDSGRSTPSILAKHKDGMFEELEEDTQTTRSMSPFPGKSSPGLIGWVDTKPTKYVRIDMWDVDVPGLTLLNIPYLVNNNEPNQNEIWTQVATVDYSDITWLSTDPRTKMQIMHRPSQPPSVHADAAYVRRQERRLLSKEATERLRRETLFEDRLTGRNLGAFPGQVEAMYRQPSIRSTLEHRKKAMQRAIAEFPDVPAGTEEGEDDDDGQRPSSSSSAQPSSSSGRQQQSTTSNETTGPSAPFVLPSGRGTLGGFLSFLSRNETTPWRHQRDEEDSGQRQQSRSPRQRDPSMRF